VGLQGLLSPDRPGSRRHAHPGLEGIAGPTSLPLAAPGILGTSGIMVQSDGATWWIISNAN
jgi:hypothetical protein